MVDFPPAVPAKGSLAAPFFAAELDAYKPNSESLQVDLGWNVAPWLALTQDPQTFGDSQTIYVSDMGYRSAPSDAGGPRPYPPLLVSGFQINRMLNLDPTRPSTGASWGKVQLSNDGGRWLDLVRNSNSDGRGARIYWGRKTIEPARGILLDPKLSDLTLAFAGVATPWQLSETTLDIPIQDATYWLQWPVQQSTYAGKGGMTGGTDLVGKPIPKARGGTEDNPVRNITPIQVDSVRLIYQYSDGPGTVVALYEGGGTDIGYAGDVPDLTQGTTPAGQYRSCNARGLFQLGSQPQKQISCDVTGAFPLAGALSGAVDLIQNLLNEDMQLPAAYLHTASFDAARAVANYAAGIWFGTDVVQGLDAIEPLLAAIGGYLVPRRDGTLGILLLRPPSQENVVDAWGPEKIISCVPHSLPSTVAPPPYRFRVGYQRNYTVQTESDLLPTVSPDRVSYLANEYRYGVWSSTTVLQAYRRANDPDPIPTALLKQEDAGAVAAIQGALWGALPSAFDVTVPMEIGLTREIGDTISLSFPQTLIADAQPALVIGDQVNSEDSTLTVTVLV